jgi:hypothetical protein
MTYKKANKKERMKNLVNPLARVTVTLNEIIVGIIKFLKKKKGNANTYLILWEKLTLNGAKMNKVALERSRFSLTNTTQCQVHLIAIFFDIKDQVSAI